MMKEFDAVAAGFLNQLQSDPCNFFYLLARELPGEQIKLNFGRESLLVCQDSESAQSMLRGASESFHKNFGAFTGFFGLSRLTADGPKWRALQALSQPLISGASPEAVAAISRLYYGEAARQIRAAAQRSPILTVDRFIDHAAAAVVMKSVLGLEIASLTPRFYDQLHLVLAHCGKASWNMGGMAPQPPEAGAGVQSAFGEVRESIMALIAEGRRGADGAALRAFYAAFESDAELFGEFCTLLFAGFDTTASTLCWAMMLLAHQPALQARLRAELEGDDAGLDPLARSPALIGLVNETLRMLPAIPILSRVAAADASLGGSQVKAGQKTLLSIIGLHNDRNIWRDPSRLDIGRFPDGVVPLKKRKHFLPFSAGPRACPGAKFAMAEIPVAIAALLRHLSFEAVDQEPVRFRWGGSMRHRDGVRLMVTSLDS